MIQSKGHISFYTDVNNHPVIPSEKRAWCLDKPFEMGYAEDRIIKIFIPEHFAWDGASVPRIGWSLMGVTPGGPMLLPSLVHDALYRTKGGTQGHGQEIEDIRIFGADSLSRKDADILFKLLMRATQSYNEVQINSCYRIVRRFGAKHWGGDAPKYKL